MALDPYGEATLANIADNFEKKLNTVLVAYLADDGAHVLINPVVLLDEQQGVIALKLVRDALDQGIAAHEGKS